MEKFDSTKHSKFIKDLPFSYFSTLINLDQTAYTFFKNDEHIIVWQDILFSHDFPSIFTPRNSANWERASIAFSTPEEVKEIKKKNIEIMLDKYIEQEFFFETKTLITPKSDTKRRINQFVNNYKFEVFNTFSREKIIDF